MLKGGETAERQQLFESSKVFIACVDVYEYHLSDGRASKPLHVQTLKAQTPYKTYWRRRDAPPLNTLTNNSNNHQKPCVQRIKIDARPFRLVSNHICLSLIKIEKNNNNKENEYLLDCSGCNINQQVAKNKNCSMRSVTLLNVLNQHCPFGRNAKAVFINCNYCREKQHVFAECGKDFHMRKEFNIEKGYYHMLRVCLHDNGALKMKKRFSFTFYFLMT